LTDFKKGGRLIWDGTDYTIHRLSDNGQDVWFYRTGREPEDRYIHEVDRLRRLMADGRVIYDPPRKSKKKSGPEMQHCPFCMAAWLIAKEQDRKKDCKYCGAGLG
jgi:hypothetical protein